MDCLSLGIPVCVAPGPVPPVYAGTLGGAVLLYDLRNPHTPLATKAPGACSSAPPIPSLRIARDRGRHPQRLCLVYGSMVLHYPGPKLGGRGAVSA